MAVWLLQVNYHGHVNLLHSQVTPNIYGKNFICSHNFIYLGCIFGSRDATEWSQEH